MDSAAATRLADARAALTVAAHAAGPPPELHASAPLRQVSPAVQARMVQRALAGRSPLGRDYPRSRLWVRTVAPLAVVALLDACGVVIAFGRSAAGLGSFAVVALVLLGGLAVLGARFALTDPLRFSAAQRRELAAAQTWASRAPWGGTLASSPERGIVATAARTAGRIVSSAALASPALDAQRARLDLVAELDELDALAAQIAQRGSIGSSDRERDALVTRVAGLVCYADELDAAERGGPTRRSIPDVTPDAVARLGEFLDAALSPAPRDTLPGGDVAAENH